MIERQSKTPACLREASAERSHALRDTACKQALDVCSRARHNRDDASLLDSKFELKAARSGSDRMCNSHGL